MKTKLKLALSLFLCAAMTVQAQTIITNPVPTQAKSADENLTLLPAILIIAVSVAGICIIYVYARDPNTVRPNTTLVLWRDHYDDAWTAIATNTVTVTTNKLKVFEDQMVGEDCRYRVSIQK